MKQKSILILLIFSTITNLFGQIPIIQTPQPATLGNYGNTNYFPQNSQPKIPQMYNPYQSIEDRNRQIIDQDMRNYELQQQQREQLLKEIRNDIAQFEQKKLQEKSYQLPSYQHLPQTEAYRKAFAELESMLEGTKIQDLKKAIFLVENAFFNNQQSYQDFNQAIQQRVDICKLLLKQENQKPTPLAKIMVIFRLMSDTLQIKQSNQAGYIQTLPFGYDFEDFYGRKDYSKMFVMKLLATQSGQCHSMPLLFLILAQELGAEAFLSFAPEHTYIKVRDTQNNWYNLELTNGMLTTDAQILGSGFIKAEALQSRMYMDTLGTRKVIAQCMTDLAQGYKNKFGYDEFVLQCAEIALAYHPENFIALGIKSDYYTLLFRHIAQTFGLDTKEKAQSDTKAWEIYEQRNRIYALIDALGYEEMPEEVYQSWLKSLNTEKERQAQYKQKLKQKSQE